MYLSACTRSLALAAFLVGATFALVPTAIASHQYCSDATPILLQGSVTRETGGWEVDWYRHETLGGGSYILEPRDANVDLYVYDSTCSNLLCARENPGSFNEYCTVPGDGPFYIAAVSRWFYMDYTLTYEMRPWLLYGLQLQYDPDGTCTIYNDRNGNYMMDEGEAIATTRCDGRGGPAVQPNPDGTCTLYVDRNVNGTIEEGEAISTIPCEARDVPFSAPGQSVSQGIPGLSIPPVPSQTVTTPAIAIPETCTLSVCTSETTVQELKTPPLDRVCAPLGLVCVGPVEPQPLTPSVTAPAVCTAVSFVCIPETILVPPQTVSAPSVPPVPLTPPVIVSVTSTAFDGLIEPNAREPTTIGPFTVTVGPVPITVCANPCTVSMLPNIDLIGAITIRVTIGGDTYSQTIPVNI